MKNFILKLPFVQSAFKHYCDIAVNEARQKERIKAFSLAQKDILETMHDDLDIKAKEIADEKLSNMLSPVDWNKVVTFDKTKGIIFIGGKRVDEGRLASLKAEAEYFAESDLWVLLCETPNDLAQKTVFVSSESLIDLQKGKSMLYHLSQQKNILNIFKAYQRK